MPEQIFDLNITHNDYDFVAQTRRRSIDLYEGFELNQSNLRNYLQKSSRETAPFYEQRLIRTVYENLLAPALEYRQALLWRKKPKVELRSSFEKYQNDVDGFGNSWEAFFHEVTMKADIEGISLCLVSMPSANMSGIIRTRADEINLGVRPYLQLINADQVLDWGFNTIDRQLDYVVIRDEVQNSEKRPGFKQEFIPQWVVLYRDKYETYVLNRDESSLSKYIKIAEGPMKMSGVPKIPIIPFYGIKKRNMTGLPYGHKVLRHLVSILNQSSEIDTAIFRTLNPIPYVISEENPESITVTDFNGVYLPKNSEFGLLEAKGNGIELAIGEMSRRVYAVYKYLLHINRKDTAQVQSEESQRQDRTVLNASLAHCSKNHEGSFRQCIQIFEQFAGNAESKNVFEFNDDFDDQQITPQLGDFLQGLAEKGFISKQHFLELLKEGEIIGDDVDLEQLLIDANEEQNGSLALGKFGFKNDEKLKNGNKEPPPLN